MNEPQASIQQIQLLQAQQRIELMQQFFDQHGLIEKARLRRHDAARLERIRASAAYSDAYAAQPLISVIVPTYNRAKIIIERTLPSVLKQDYAHWELLIVADCMDDAQAAMLSEAAAGDPRVHFHNLKRRGKYPSMKGPCWYVAGNKPVNFGLRCARGAWIAHLDDDDEFMPGHLSTLLHAAQTHRSEWAHSQVRFIDDMGREQGLVGSEIPAHGLIARIGTLYHAGLKTFRYNPGCWKYFCPGDWDLWDRLLQMGVSHTHVPAVTAIHHGDYFRNEIVDNDDPQALKITHREPTPTEAYRQWLQPMQLSALQVSRQAARLDAYRTHVVVIDTTGDMPALQRSLASLAAQHHQPLQISVLSVDGAARIEGVSVRPLQDNAVAQLNALMSESAAPWLLPLYAGDELAEHALLLLADRAAAQPGMACCYFDEDACQSDGYDHPLFKPDFNLDLLRSYPYIGRTLAISKKALTALGGLNADLTQLAHCDLVLRIVERFDLAAVGHITEVLYHANLPFSQWLATPAIAGESAAIVSAHLQRLNVAHEVLPGSVPGMNRVRYRHAHQPMVSIIVPTRDQLPMLNGLIDSLLAKTSYPHYELLIVDNDSREPAACAYLDGIERLQSSQLRVLRYPHPFNYSAINNFAAAQARGEYLILLNNDTAVLHEDWIEALLHHAQRPEIGIVGAKLYYPDGRIQHGGVVLGLRGPADHPFIGEPGDAHGYMHRLQVDQNYTAVTAACLMVRKSIYEQVGGLDEKDFKVSYNDVDFCLKVHQAGYLAVWTPYARLMHEGSVSQTKVDKTAQEAKQKRFQGEQNAMYRKWLPVLARDPAYNINMSIDGVGFGLDPQRNKAWQPFAEPLLPRLFCVAADETGCGHYRIRQPFDAMRREGLAEGMVASEHLLPAAMERFGPHAIVLQRQVSDLQIKLLESYRDFSRAFKVYELDDYLPNVPVKSAFHGIMPKDVIKSLRRAIGTVDRFVVSTAALAEQFKGFSPDIRVVSNRLPVTWWGDLNAQRRAGGKLRVGWGGGASHQGDLELIADVVRDLASEVEWVFFGMCPDKIRPYIHEFHSGVPIEQYPAKLASLNLDLALAPLEDNVFNACKSNLRLLEYGACGFPVVCSDIRCYDGNLPVTRVKNRYKDWMAGIRMHLDDPDATAKAGDALREAVHADWMLSGDHLSDWLKAWLPG